MNHDIHKSGIPVLAYPHCDAAPTSFSMLFRFNDTQATASILLQTSLLVDGHHEPQTCTMQYDADMLEFGSLGPATIPLPQYRLDKLAREGSPQMQTLSLTLKRLAPVWVLHNVRLRPQPGQEAAFDRVAVLAQAAKLHILLDFKWLHRDQQAVFRRLIDHPEQLRAFPVWRQYSKLYQRADWRVFAESVPDELVGEFPPQYDDKSLKRPRNVTPTPSSPLHKRALFSPYDAHQSPTEKDSVATPNPHALSSSSASPSPRLPTCDVTPDAHHAHTTEPATSSGLTTVSVPLPQYPLESAISSLLPDILSSMLPDILSSLLPRLLTLQSPSPAPSLLDAPSQRKTPPPSLSALLGTPRASKTVPTGRPAVTLLASTAPLSAEEKQPPASTQPPPLSNLGVSISDHVARKIECVITSLYSHVLSHANFLRNEADDDFFEEREGERLSWQREVESSIEEFKERLADLGIEGVEHVEEVLERKGESVVERVEKIMEEAMARVDRLRDEENALKREVKEFKRDKKELKRDKKELKRDKKALMRDIEYMRRQKSDLRRDISALRRQKGELQDELRNASSSSVSSAGSAIDSQDLDA